MFVLTIFDDMIINFSLMTLITSVIIFLLQYKYNMNENMMISYNMF